MAFRDPDGLLDGFTPEEQQEYVEQGLAHFDEHGGFHEGQMTDEETQEFFDDLESDLPENFW